VKTEKVHIGVSKEQKKTAVKEMGEYQKEYGFEKYEIEDYEEGRFECTSLHIGQKLTSDVTMQCFLFSGTVIDEASGITVAHGIDAVEEKISLSSGSAAEVAKQIVGKCRKKIDNMPLESGQITADLAVVELEPDFTVRQNTVPWPGREIRIQIYKGEPMPSNKRVMILNQDGDYCYGAIRREIFDDRLAAGRYYNVLAVSSDNYDKEVAITREGDSGALVMSTPEDNPDVVFVYGIVIALYICEDRDTSLTIANSLWQVVKNIDSFRQQSSRKFPKCATDDVIDFTWMDPAVVPNAAELQDSPEINNNDQRLA